MNRGPVRCSITHGRRATDFCSADGNAGPSVSRTLYYSCRSEESEAEDRHSKAVERWMVVQLKQEGNFSASET